ncbi:putative tautomerase YrdN [Methylocella tundrae]|uniref:Putative tautomerase YrdN n=1 Tax=Methylocella tundrae TaxID=227605 RepID=A0A4U8Z3T6_METTU|nr:tautomerase family protein [Methylocella tundrae]WPP03890.1 tautomerase family protein [Methylocella tundrae]VFU10088.1 putative tautomerase YrdN [Methylocella tundrae]VTZ25385.1 putative tautomerase YrdN [Methylocella tundrae]VTZ50317.1 putative tautomerase YrdN [Methylocella tundrae]
MPLLRFDLVEGRSDESLAALLDAAHAAMLDAFHVPADDRYQIVNEHPASRMVIKDTGLGIARTANVVVVQVTTRPRPQAQKVDFYARLARYLHERCGVDPADLMVSCVENTDEDWSFGHGRAQFLTGEL